MSVTYSEPRVSLELATSMLRVLNTKLTNPPTQTDSTAGKLPEPLSESINSSSPETQTKPAGSSTPDQPQDTSAPPPAQTEPMDSAAKRLPKTIGEILAYVARVSNPGNQHNHQSAPKLLAHCLREGHWSVFETASLTMKIETSRAISQQVIRHRSFCFQEFSLRYAEAPSKELYKARRQDKKNRQNSIDDMPAEDEAWWVEAQEKAWELSFGLYNEALRRGIAKECARFILPLATSTTIFVTGNIRSWIHYTLARTAEGVQREHFEIAVRCLFWLIRAVPELIDFLDSKLSDRAAQAIMDLEREYASYVITLPGLADLCSNCSAGFCVKGSDLCRNRQFELENLLTAQPLCPECGAMPGGCSHQFGPNPTKPTRRR